MAGRLISFELRKKFNRRARVWLMLIIINFKKKILFSHFRTNLPKEVMQIPDFPFRDQEGPSFVHHSVIREYLLDYANHFDLHPYIKVSSWSLFLKRQFFCFSQIERDSFISARFLAQHIGEARGAGNSEKRSNIMDADVRGSRDQSRNHENLWRLGSVQWSLHCRSCSAYSRYR